MAERALASSRERESVRSTDIDLPPPPILPLERRRAIGTGARASSMSAPTSLTTRAIQMFADAVGAGLHGPELQPDDAHATG